MPSHPLAARDYLLSIGENPNLVTPHLSRVIGDLGAYLVRLPPLSCRGYYDEVSCVYVALLRHPRAEDWELDYPHILKFAARWAIEDDLVSFI